MNNKNDDIISRSEVQRLISEKFNTIKELITSVTDNNKLIYSIQIIESDIDNYFKGNYPINWKQLECDIAKTLYPSFIKHTNPAKETVKYAKELIEELKKDIYKTK